MRSSSPVFHGPRLIHCITASIWILLEPLTLSLACWLVLCNLVGLGPRILIQTVLFISNEVYVCNIFSSFLEEYRSNVHIAKFSKFI